MEAKINEFFVFEIVWESLFFPKWFDFSIYIKIILEFKASYGENDFEVILFFSEITNMN